MYWPFSPYHLGRARLVGSPTNAPLGCLSIPKAIATSARPARMASAAVWTAVAEVAQALNTSVKGMPLRPTRLDTALGLVTVWLPPTPNWMSRHVTPASFRASWMASAPMAIAVLSPKRPNGWRPTPMMATSFMTRSPRSAVTGANANMRTSSPSSSVYSGRMVSSTSMPNRSFSGSPSVRRPSTLMTSPSCTRPMPNGSKVSAVSDPA